MIFNSSLNSGTLPRQWRDASIRPIYKKGKKSLPSNYRPVSLTSISCKIMERIIRKDMGSFLEKMGIITKDQHGFREGRSCCTQLLEIMEIWTSMLDNGAAWDCIYLDFAKAFDRVPHQRLLVKLRACGISGKVLKWIQGFLSDRRQSVSINDSKSEWKPVTSGIPQGSVLGPLLFVVFINDLPQEINSCTKLFADDTKIFRAIENAVDAEALQSDIDKLSKWAAKWQLPFNSDKCKVIHYGKNPLHYNYKMNDNILAVEDNEKDLGVMFQSNLSFRKHIRSITARANSRVGLIKHSFSCLDKENLLPLYKSQVRPLLEYCSSVWDPILKGDIIEIEKVQHRATKLVPNLSNKPYPDRLKELGLKTLAFRRKRTDIIQVFRILKGIDKVDPATFFTHTNSTMTRGHKLKLVKPRSNSNLRLHSFSQRVINVWNSLPDYAINCNTVNSFKSALDKVWANDELQFDIPHDFSPIMLH